MSFIEVSRTLKIPQLSPHHDLEFCQIMASSWPAWKGSPPQGAHAICWSPRVLSLWIPLAWWECFFFLCFCQERECYLWFPPRLKEGFLGCSISITNQFPDFKTVVTQDSAICLWKEEFCFYRWSTEIRFSSQHTFKYEKLKFFHTKACPQSCIYPPYKRI